VPFVFVHGVNNRRDEEYLREEQIRAAFLSQIVAAEIKIDPDSPVFSPYWGGDGVSFRRNLSVVPGETSVESFGSQILTLSPSLGIGIADGQVNKDDSLDALAKKNPSVAVDILFDNIIQQAHTNDDIASVAKAFQRAQSALSVQDSQWLKASNLKSFEDDVLDVLSPPSNALGAETYGAQAIYRMLVEAISRTVLAVPEALAFAVSAPLRKPGTHAFATFTGDVFAYLSERGDGNEPGLIASKVITDLREAKKLARSKEEPLVVISHSFGGEIVYDILTHYAPEIEVDVWITVGSQVGLFEEMSLLWTSAGRIDKNAATNQSVTSPKNVKRWINIIDSNDVLGFLIEPIFTPHSTGTVKDYLYNTAFPIYGAHSGYFKWPSFYKRMAKRLREGINP